MNEYKILFTGTMGAGKTTAIGAVSDTAPITMMNSAMTQAKMGRSIKNLAMMDAFT